MMAKSKKHVSDITRTVSLDQALVIQDQAAVCMNVLFKYLPGGNGDPRNPANPPPERETKNEGLCWQTSSSERREQQDQ